MKKLKFVLTTVCLSFVSIISPTWIGIIYMHITGHGKGYGYDMSAESDISVLIGIILLGLWIISIFPAMAWLSKKCYNFKKTFIFAPLIGFVMLFILGIFLLGLNEFVSFFGC